MSTIELHEPEAEVKPASRSTAAVLPRSELVLGPALPPRMMFSDSLLEFGVQRKRKSHYTGHDCTGCGICFYCCPEPEAIMVYRLVPPQNSDRRIPARRPTCGSSVKETSPSLRAVASPITDIPSPPRQ
jgi:NAD-dependent dihydropyrimidine dehydrogenase PreA subunit